MVAPSAKRRGVKALVEGHNYSVQMACEIAGLSRQSYYYKPKRRKYEELLIKELYRLNERYPRYGYPKVTAIIRERGWRVNLKRVRRLRRQEGLKVPVKQAKKRRLGKSTSKRQQALYPNHVWSWDFIFDRTEDGRQIKILNIVDEYSRFSVRLEARSSFTSKEVITALGNAMMDYGIPACIRSDNGSEFISHKVKDWLAENGVKIMYIEPASPWQNPYVESLNARLRDECLNRELFGSILEAKVVLDDWQQEYNTERPHGALNMKTPATVYGKYIAATAPMGAVLALKTKLWSDYSSKEL